MTIAVVDSGEHAWLRGSADAIADALARDAGSDEGPRIALPDGETARDPRGAGAALALDPAALERAIDAGVPFRAAWIGWLDPRWEDVLGRADRVLVAHPALLEGAIAMGAARSRTIASGPVAPPGACADRAAAREALGLSGEAPLVIVPAAVIGDDLTGMLLQLALARDGIRFLFDVGRDARAADALRRRVTFAAHMFAEGDAAADAWAAADAVLARLDGPELGCALAFRCAPILAPPRAGDRSIARALADAHVATVAATESTLAVAIDEACRDATLAASRAALAALDPEHGAERVASELRRGIDEHARGRTPEGLPRGLEAIGPSATASAERAAAGAPGGGGSPRSRDEEIERELAELRARLARE